MPNVITGGCFPYSPENYEKPSIGLSRERAPLGLSPDLSLIHIIAGGGKDNLDTTISDKACYGSSPR